MGNSRRDFLKKSGMGLVTLSAMTPNVWLRSALANGKGAGATDKVLVVLQLDGGNDGLNTVVPYTQGAYYDARPTLGIAEADLLHIDGGLGLHPALAALVPFYSSQKLAIVNGVGYPTPDRSHFRSREIWQTADPVHVDPTGWLGRYADAHLVDAGELAAINIGGTLSKGMRAETYVAPSIEDLATYRFLTDATYAGDRTNQVNAYLATNAKHGQSQSSKVAATATDAYTGSEQLQAAAGGYVPKATYPDTRLADDLKFAAQIITAGVGTRVIYLTTGGYDTHADEPNDSQKLHQTFAEALAAFQADVEAQGVADRVALLAFSEFGRRVEENGSSGTDHGTAGPMFLLGAGVAGGLHGEYPSLAPSDLDSNGDLVFTVDFRSVYADALETWLGVGSQDILGGSFTKVGVFK